MEEPSGGGGGDQSKTPGVSSSYRESLARVASTTRQPSNPTLATLYVSASAGLFPQVPNYIVGESEMEATNDGLNLLDFKSTLSLWELLVDRRASSSVMLLHVFITRKAVGLATIPIHPRRAQPIAKNSCPGKFSRNAGLVASAVARNLNRVGNYIKRDI
ncbi:hypothetical protein HPP92_028379 [Vanilla planifolia]|uniref:Uncharacterized protein n=1 Tax=Vanilla planifolia TaxID=51239 RepID=A0A835P896_VANPL|nr:hypothetical protein HPP92_028379 [Vanilla planifolia]